MNGSGKIQPTHLERQALVYIRQSDPKQVLKNRESGFNQRALRERALELGWKKSQIVLIDDDQGQSGKEATARSGFQALVAAISLRKVGIVIGYEVSRLSRNCADWQQVLQLCSLFDALIADADGIYNPRDFNDKLLLGIKGQISEAELHSLRLRLDAGRLSKAKRGELVHHLPTGLVRDSDGEVQFDPDTSVQARIRLVFSKFQELQSAQKVMRYLAQHGLKLPRRQNAGLLVGELLWKEPSISAVHSILKNPAYAGAFAYGRRRAEPSRQIPGRPATGRLRQPRDRWLALVKGVYPAYITWAEYEQIQHRIAQNGQQMRERLMRIQAVRQGTALLPGLVRCGICGYRMQVSYKDGRFQYLCNVGQTRYAKPSCQYLSGRRIDAAVVEEFFRVLQPAEIDALQRLTAKQIEHHHELVSHLEQEVQRLEYAAQRAQRQYNCVDPENRLIAATLEKKWENALAECEQAKERLADMQAQAPQPVQIPADLREAFTDAGRRLPEVWPQLSAEAKKRLLRTLVTGVNLRRQDNGLVQMRIVWVGGMVSESMIRVPVASRQRSMLEKKIVARIEQLAEQGLRDEELAERLNEEGYYPCRGDVFTPHIVLKLRTRFRIRVGLGRLRAGERPVGYTISAMARILGVNPSWIYRALRAGRIRMEKDVHFGCYVFPNTKKAIKQLKQLRQGKVCHVTFLQEHCDG
ncbi:MAG: recombinase family protein [Pirellulales bacterium]|nr:recombinase family protein [Pirellulales bacterium]